MGFDIRMQELIAIAASITANCHPCIEHHVAKARDNGVDEQAIADAIEVGKMVRKGAAAQMDKRVSTLNLAATAGSQQG